VWVFLLLLLMFYLLVGEVDVEVFGGVVFVFQVSYM